MNNLMPFMSLRGLALFPDGKVPLEIGRTFTIASIGKAIDSYDRKIVISAQRTIEMSQEPKLNEIFNVGCLCRIEDCVEFPDGCMKVLINPLERFEIESLQDVDGVRFCAGKILPKFADREEISPEQKMQIYQALEKSSVDPSAERLKNHFEQLKKIENSYEFIMKAGYLLSLRKVVDRQLTLAQINEGIFVIDTYTKTEKSVIDSGVARIQEILESKNTKAALKKIAALTL
jgi:ATP-dependent Lon protease